MHSYIKSITRKPSRMSTYAPTICLIVDMLEATSVVITTVKSIVRFAYPTANFHKSIWVIVRSP